MVRVVFEWYCIPNDRSGERKEVLTEGVKRTDRLMIMVVWNKILRRVYREGFVCYGGKLDTNSAVNR